MCVQLCTILTKFLWYQTDNLIVLPQVIFAVASETQVEQAEMDRINWIIWRILVVDDRRHIPTVARVSKHIQDKAEEEDTKREPC